MSKFFLTLHAMDAYRIHEPDADTSDITRALEEAVEAGFEVSPETAAQVCGRSRVDRLSRYLIAKDCRGMFVAARDGAIITYLRFQASQRSLVWGWFYKDMPMPDYAPARVTQFGLLDLQAKREEAAAIVKNALEAQRLKEEEVKAVQQEVRACANERKRAQQRLQEIDDEIGRLTKKEAL